MNGFPDAKIPKEFKKDPYRILIVADMFQTGFDKPLLVDLFLSGAERDRLDPILDACTDIYKQLELDDQIKFKSAAKSFVRTYGFLGTDSSLWKC